MTNQNEIINGQSCKSNKLKERFKREICEALKQISGCVGAPCSPHNYESAKTEAVVNELCERLVNITDDQLARAIHNFNF